MHCPLWDEVHSELRRFRSIVTLGQILRSKKVQEHYQELLLQVEAYELLRIEKEG